MLTSAPSPVLVRHKQWAIRRLTEHDAAAHSKLRLHALTESPTAFSSSLAEERNRPMAEVAAMIGGHPERAFFGAWEDAAGGAPETLVGLIGFGREQFAKQRHKGFVRSFYVLPHARLQGLGRALLGQALAFGDALDGLAQIVLTVTDGNDAALHLYDATGFRRYGVEPNSLLIDGRHYDEILMIRSRPERA